MSDFKQRLEKEIEELADKLNKLLVFLDSKDSKKLSEANLLLLKKQSVIMNDYLNILLIRLELLSV